MAKKVIHIPCNSREEAERAAREINDVSPPSVFGEAMMKSDGTWIVRVVVG